MKEFVIKAILQPFLAILFCLGFGLPFTYVGFQVIDIHGSKDSQAVVRVDFTRKHFFGIYQVHEQVDGVENAALKTTLYRRKSNRHFLGSGVFIETGTEAVRLVAGSSNMDDDLKWEMVRTINDFIDDPETLEVHRTFRITNLFGWFGLPFLILGVWGLLAWPFSILRQIKAR
jgi:hypothetical protein